MTSAVSIAVAAPVYHPPSHANGPFRWMDIFILVGIFAAVALYYFLMDRSKKKRTRKGRSRRRRRVR